MRTTTIRRVLAIDLLGVPVATTRAPVAWRWGAAVVGVSLALVVDAYCSWTLLVPCLTMSYAISCAAIPPLSPLQKKWGKTFF